MLLFVELLGCITKSPLINSPNRFPHWLLKACNTALRQVLYYITCAACPIAVPQIKQDSNYAQDCILLITLCDSHLSSIPELSLSHYAYRQKMREAKA